MDSNSIYSFSLLNFRKNAKNSKRLLLTTVKQALSVSLYEGIIFLSYFKEKRIKKCQRKDIIMSIFIVYAENYLHHTD